MKTTHLATLAALAGTLALPALATAQTGPISSSILGYYTLRAQPGNTFFAVGLVKKKEHQGAMDGISVSNGQTTITENDRTFTPGEFSNHYVEILEEGTWQGLVLDIVSNDANTITVDGDLGGGFGLGGAEAFCVREHVNLDSLLDDGAGLEPYFDVVTVFRSDGTSQGALYDGAGGWVDATDFVTNVGSEIIYPGTGILVTISGSEAKDILIGRGGVSHVKETPTIVPCVVGAVNLVGVMNPLVANDVSDPLFPSTLTLGETGVLESGFADYFDTFQTFSSDGSLGVSGTFVVDNAQSMVIDGTDFFTDRTDLEIPVGSAFIVNPQVDPIFFKLPGVVVAN